MPFDFRGKTAVVTGGANGIGLAARRSLGAGGASVFVFDVAGEGIAVDVTNRASIDASFAQSGPPDIVIAIGESPNYGQQASNSPRMWS